MKIYDINKAVNESSKTILLDELPTSITTDRVAHIIEGKEDVEEFPFSRFDNLVYINNILIENIRLEGDSITGDISFKHLPNKLGGRRDLQTIDLSEDNSYKILFKPAFECTVIDKKVIPEKFHNFQVYLIEKAKFREERLSKLLEV